MTCLCGAYSRLRRAGSSRPATARLGRTRPVGGTTRWAMRSWTTPTGGQGASRRHRSGVPGVSRHKHQAPRATCTCARSRGGSSFVSCHTRCHHNDASGSAAARPLPLRPLRSSPCSEAPSQFLRAKAGIPAPRPETSNGRGLARKLSASLTAFIRE